MGDGEEEEIVINFPKAIYFLEDQICEAAANNRLSMMRRILQERVDPNYLNGFGLSPLHIASDKGHFEIVKLLVCNKAKVDISNASGVTPLHLAARADQFKCAQLLLLAGADCAKECWSKCTPREFAPKDSATRMLLERCEQGMMPDPRTVFEMDIAPLVPKFAIPPKSPDNKSKKAQPGKRM